MVKFAPEGYPFIFGCLAVTALSVVLLPWGTPVPLALAVFMAYFFRDPERTIPQGRDVFVSPADGKVILVQRVREDRHLKDDTVEISIFMSPLDVHVNRAPCDGVVESVVPTPGKFLSAFKHEASLQNESIAMLLDSSYGKILVRQVAGFLARRAVCRAKSGDVLKRGERYGIIKFSSRVDLYLPAETQVEVNVGDRVRAGETILGRI